MEIQVDNDWGKTYIEILPSISFGWGSKKVLFFSWLMWSISIVF